MNQISVGQVIRHLRTQNKLTLAQLADQVDGYDAANLSRFERGKQDVTEDKLRQMAAILGKSVSALYLMAEQPVTNPDKTTNKKCQPKKETFTIPLLSYSQASEWHEGNQIDVSCWRDTTVPLGERAFALKVEGDSMSTSSGSISIPAGSIVIVDPEHPYKNGDIVVAKVRKQNSHSTVIKKIATDGFHTTLNSLAEGFPPIMLDGENHCAIIGTVRRVELDL